MEYAKSIKLTGCIPTATEIGSICFDDFLKYAREEWNFYNDPRTVPFMNIADKLILKEPQEWSVNDVEHILGMYESFDVEEMMFTHALHGYFQVISDMKEFGYDSDIVQKVVRLLHEYIVGHNTEPITSGQITPQIFAKYIAPFFLEGDVAIQYERNYGKEGCLFIAKAIAFYGGYDIEKI